MTRVLAIAAHPDDIEFLMAGTLLHLRSAGTEIAYWNLADGCCGSAELDAEAIAAIRLAEAQRSAEALGATFVSPICRDLEIFYDKSTLAKVAAVVRRIAPDILLTHSPVDYMEDHTNTSRLVVTAAFVRSMRNFSTIPAEATIEQSIAIYHAQPYFHRDPLGKSVRPELFVDVSGVVEEKVRLLETHQSQREWLDRSQGQNSYAETLRRLDAECGDMSGCFQFAEGWRRHWHIGFSTADFDPLRELLSEELMAG